MTIHRIGKKPKAAPSVPARNAWSTGIPKSTTATSSATTSEMTPASQAFRRRPPSSTNRVMRGIAPHRALRNSESPTGCRSCWNIVSPEVVGGSGGKQGGDRKAADRGVQDLDGVGEAHRLAAFLGGPLDGRGDLHQASGGGGHQDVGAGGDDVGGLAVTELAGGLGVEDVVDPGRAAAQLGLRDLPQLEPRDRLEQPSWLGAHALGMGEVARVVVGDGHLERVAGRDRTELVEDLG